MRKRDLGILLLSAFAIFFSLQHGGDFSFKEAWMHPTDDYPIKYDAERLPPPVVADLNGDGKSEILVATHDAKIQVLEPHSRRVDQGFSEARVLAEVSLLPDKVRWHCRSEFQTWGDKEAGVGRGHIGLEDFPHGAHHREIAISISNFTLKHGDSGLIIVGGRMEMQSHNSMDMYEEAMISEKMGDVHRRSASEKEDSGNSATVDLRHFAFYAFAGRTGTVRWTRKNENIQVQPSDVPQTIPQHNYKLDVHALNSRHPGEFECREFRESILGVMPHHWDRREDTSLQLAHFRRHKRKSLKKTPGKAGKHPFHMPAEDNPPGKDSSNKISSVIGKAANMAGSVRSQKRSLYIPTITNHTQLWWVPNVVVAHQKEGIEAVHLASGRTICKLHLPEGGLHADINGDGVLDHVQVVGGHGAEQRVVTGSMEVLKPCWAIATSGVPVREQLFNASICHHALFNLFQHDSRSFGRSVDVGTLEVATPILVHRDDGQKHKRRSHGDVVFLTNRGEVTSYSPGLHGEGAIWRWQLTSGATWSNLPSPSGMMEDAVVPTLKSFRLRIHDHHEVIIAGGDQEAVIISPRGSMLATIELPESPTHSLVLEDFTGDGLTDIVLLTSGGVYGFVQVRQPGALFFSTLVGCLIVIMGVIFVSQYLNSGGKSKPRVSTEYR
ncbi:uncharacterized protein A4U43_C04F33860 [Asparagus officinalis]|uniref:FG-GAP repeat-containing protein n=1 Tax=Asparagus officinalis TaxID=4686 RepID=A0A5P1F657_ASPOF|nr:uncharacterized protein A4U43_C04F33860 [Asparagus officinalis]